MRAHVALFLLLGCQLAASRLASAQCLAAHGQVIARECASLEISRDDGATFVQTRAAVGAVTVTTDDRVFAVDDGEPPSLFEVGGSTRQALPLASVSALGSVGRAVIVAGIAPGDDWIMSVLALDTRGLRELGRFPISSSAIELSVSGTERDPHVEIVNFIGLSCWGTVEVRRVSLDGHGLESASLLDDDECAGGQGGCAHLADVEIGAHGSAYARSSDGQGSVIAGPLLLVRPVERASPTSLWVEAEGRLSIAHNGALTFALLDGVLYRLEGTRTPRLPGRLETDAYLVYVDPRGRPFAETAQATLRYSRRGGWSPLP
jgi:hypothetical protein